MQNDQVFAGSANIDVASALRSRPAQRGHDAVTAASGGLEISKDSDYENTPLVVRDEEDLDGRPGNPSGDQTSEVEWEGGMDFEGRPWWNKPSVFWMLPPFFLSTLSFGAVIVPRLNVILSLICRQYFSDRSMNDSTFQFMPVILGNDNPQCQIPQIQSLVANFTLYGNLIAGIFSAMISPKLGSLSDRYGRKKLIAYGSTGLLISDVITVLAESYPETFPVQWMLAGFFFDGICGSFTGAMALTFAYASDCTPPARRNIVFGWFHASLFGGIALGPVFGGYIIKASGNIVTIFYVTLICHSIFFLFIVFVLPESLSKARQQAAREKKSLAREESEGSTFQSSNKWRSILKSYNFLAPLTILYPTGEGSSSALRRNLVLLASVDTGMFGVAMGSMTIMIIYAEYMFDWGTFQTAVFVTIINVTRVSVLLLGPPLLTRIFRGRRSTAVQQNSGSDTLDVFIMRVSICFDLIGFIGYATVKTGPLYILSGIITSLGGLCSPTLTAAMTKHVPQDRTGQILGAMGLLHALARVVAPTIFNLIYSRTVATVPQTVFVCLAATFGVSFVLSWFIRPHVYWNDAKRAMSQQDDGSEEEDL